MRASTGKTDTFHRLTYAAPSDPWLKRLLITSVEYASGRRRLERLYREIQQEELRPAEIWGAALDKLNIRLRYAPEQLRKAPAEGPLVLIANHPFGVVDGLILGHLAAQVRPRFVMLVNGVLIRQDPRLQSFLLPVDFRENREAMHINLRTRQEALARLARGEALAIFPSGGVATAPGGWGAAEDLEWKRFVARVIQQAGATVIPLFVHGQNSRLFQLASQLSASLRLGLLMHEVHNKIGREIRLEIGDPIPYAELTAFRDRQALLDHLRGHTLALGRR
jgi:putative hemolysin